MAWSQVAPLGVDAFVEGGGSFITNTENQNTVPSCKLPDGQPCPRASWFSDAGRLFTGARFRAGHNAYGASYSYSDNNTTWVSNVYNRLDLYSFNYVRYLRLKSRVQPFATIGLGASRFTGPPNTRTDFKFVWNYGGGGDIALHWHMALRLELRDYVGGQPQFWSGTSHNIVPTAGLVFKFSELIQRPH